VRHYAEPFHRKSESPSAANLHNASASPERNNNLYSVHSDGMLIAKETLTGSRVIFENYATVLAFPKTVSMLSNKTR
jgi:hypothetical protein